MLHRHHGAGGLLALEDAPIGTMPMPAAPLAGVEASADIARGLQAHSGWCSSPCADRLAPERVPPRRVGEVLRLQRDLVQKQEANYPVRWYEPELEHQVETAWCSAIMKRAARTEDCLVYVFGTTIARPPVTSSPSRSHSSTAARATPLPSTPQSPPIGSPPISPIASPSSRGGCARAASRRGGSTRSTVEWWASC